MGLNWVEDIVSEWYRLEGYLVVENEDLQMPKTGKRKIRGHSDIDVMAIKDKELVHIECQTWWGPEKIKEQKGIGIGGRVFTVDTSGYLSRVKMRPHNQ